MREWLGGSRAMGENAYVPESNADLESKVAQLARELAESRQQQAATAEVLRAISGSTFDLDTVLTTLIQTAIKLCEATRGVIWLRHGEQLFLAAHVNYSDEWVAFAKANPLTPSADAVTTSGLAAFTGEVVHVEDVPNDPRFRSLAAHKLGDYRAGLAVPLKRGDQVVGVISLSRPEARLFTDQQVALVQTFADQAVIAIENARLFDEVQSRNRALTESLEQQTAMSEILRVISRSPTDVQPVFETISESAARLCQARFCSVFRFDGELVHFMAQHGMSPEAADLQRRAFPSRPGQGSAAARAILSGSVAQVPDVEADANYSLGTLARILGARSILSVPMLRDGRPVGAINIGRSELGKFPHRQIELLKTFADQAVIAIENVRLFEEVQTRNRDLAETLEQQVATSAILSAIAASPTDIQPVLDAVTESAAQLIDAYDTTIFLRREDVLDVASHRGVAIRMDFDHLPLRRDVVTSRAVLDRKTIHVHDLMAEGDEYPTGQALARQMGFRTTLATPLLREGEAIGALMIRRTEVRPFSDRQVQLLRTFADQAVIAIENVRLFEEVQARTRELTESLERQTAASEILRVIARSPADVQPVFDTIASSVAQLCAARFCIVFRFDGELVHFVAAHGLPPEAVAGNRQAFPMPPGRGSAAARAILSRTVEQIPDVEADSDFAHARITRLAKVRSLIAVPMLKDDVPVGAIVVARPQIGFFPERQIELLKTFADQAVIAIENVRLFEEVQARTAELSESLQQQTATADVLKVISRSAFDLGTVLDALIASAVRLCAADMGAITLREGDRLRFKAGAGQSPELRAYEMTHPHPLSRGTFQGRAAVEGKTIHIPNVLEDAEYERREATKHFGAVLSVPLKRGAEVIGVFGLARRTVGPFGPRQIELVENFADQAVIAIENVRLFDEVQARTAELSESLQQQIATADVLKVISRSAFDLQTVLDTLTVSAAQLCDADLGGITRQEPDGFYYVTNYNLPPAWQEYVKDKRLAPERGSTVGRALLDRKIVHVADVLADPEYTFLQSTDQVWYRTVLGVPLMREGNPIGVLVLGRVDVRPFTEKQIDLIQTFADQAVIAIENVRLFEEVQARTAELSESLQQQIATADVLKVISRSAFDLQAVLDTLSQSVAHLCDAEWASITRQVGSKFYEVSNYGYTAEFNDYIRSFPHEPGRGTIVGRALLEAKPVQVPDVLADSEYTLKEGQRLGGYRTVLGVPMMREGSPIGVIVLSRSTVNAFTDKQIELVTTFADQAVIAIENVRLFDEVQARTAELSAALQQQTATADVLQAISRSTFDLDSVLKTLIESATRLCDTGPGQIWRRDGDVYRLAVTQVHDPDYEKLERQHEIRPGRGTLVGRALLEGGAVQIVDILADPEYELKEEARVGNFRSGLSVPLLRSGEPIGAFAFGRHRVEPFTDRQVELVKTFADQAVIAIENARLFEEVQARTAELSEALQQQTATADVLKVISRSAFDLGTVLNTLIASACQLCNAEMGLIFLAREGSFYPEASHGTPPGYLEFIRTHPIKPGRETFTGRAALTKAVVNVADALEDKEFTFSEARDRASYRAMLAVPLLRQGEVIGVFAMPRSAPGAFSDRQIELVQTFADQAVIAIENVRLFNEVQHRTEELSRSLEELQTAQDRLVQTEKLASLGQLTAGIAHEIKNPLNFVNNFSALSAELIGELQDLLSRAALDEKMTAEVNELSAMLKSNLEKVTHHGKRADSIVKNMLLHSRQGSGEHRPSDINAIVEESLNLAYHGARAEKKGFNITLEKSLDPAAGEVDIYPQEITRVLINLISNGFYATTKRNAEANGAPYEPVLVAATRNLGNSVEIRIRDNGTGIPPEVKERMFNPFFTTKPVGEGTGLGLSLSHDIVVKQHAGTIQVETEPGSFTEFRIVLPRGAASLGKSGGNA